MAMASMRRFSPAPAQPPAVPRTRPMPKHLFLTGSPGCGKTTLIRRLVEHLQTQFNCQVQGFFTEEVRKGGERIGFDVVTLDGRRSVLARSGAGGKGKPMVGKYAVDVLSFEALALPQLDPSTPGMQLWVVDEVGKMELKSRAFFPAVVSLLSRAPCVLGTLPLPQTGRLIAEVEAVRERSDVEVVHVRRDNRDALLAELAARLEVRLKTT